LFYGVAFNVVYLTTNIFGIRMFTIEILRYMNMKYYISDQSNVFLNILPN